LLTGWGKDRETYRGLHVGEDMPGVLPNFIFYKIVRIMNFASSQHHTSVICLLLLLQPLILHMSSVITTLTFIFTFIILYISYTRTCVISSIEVMKV
jgi:hypothetical protein